MHLKLISAFSWGEFLSPFDPQLQWLSNETCSVPWKHSVAWRERLGAPSAPVKAYMDRIEYVSEKDPVLLVAHAYTQQMALLAGGQRISKYIRSTMPSVNGDQGVSVFQFDVRGLTLSLDFCFILPLCSLSVSLEIQSAGVVEAHLLMFIALFDRSQCHSSRRIIVRQSMPWDISLTRRLWKRCTFRDSLIANFL